MTARKLPLDIEKKIPYHRNMVAEADAIAWRISCWKWKLSNLRRRIQRSELRQPSPFQARVLSHYSVLIAEAVKYELTLRQAAYRTFNGHLVVEERRLP